MDSKMIAILYLISLGVFFVFLVIATIMVVAGSIKKKKKNKIAKNWEDSEYEDEEYNYQTEVEEVPVPKDTGINLSVQDDVFEEAVMAANQIANETAAEAMSMQAVQQTQPVQPVQQAQSVQPVQPVQQAQSVQPAQPVQPVQQAQSVQPAQPMQPAQQVDVAEAPDNFVAPMMDSNVMAEESIFAEANSMVEDSAFVDSAFAEDSAFTDSAFADSAFADSAFTDSAFADSAFSNNADGNAFPGSAFETPTLIDPAAMEAATVNVSHGAEGQDPVGNFYWFNKEDVEDRPEYKPVEMFYRHFTTASECIEDLLIEMYDCALVRTEEIRYIAYGIEPRHVAMRDVAATGSAAYNASKKRKEPTKEDIDKIYRKWCSYVDKLFEIVEFRADNTTIGIIRDKLYEFGKSDIDVLIEGK